MPFSVRCFPGAFTSRFMDGEKLFAMTVNFRRVFPTKTDCNKLAIHLQKYARNAKIRLTPDNQPQTSRRNALGIFIWRKKIRRRNACGFFKKTFRLTRARKRSTSTFPRRPRKSSRQKVCSTNPRNRRFPFSPVCRTKAMRT